MRRSFIKSQNPECLTLISSNPNSQLKGKILNPTFFFLLKNKSRFKKTRTLIGKEREGGSEPGSGTKRERSLSRSHREQLRYVCREQKETLPKANKIEEKVRNVCRKASRVGSYRRTGGPGLILAMESCGETLKQENMKKKKRKALSKR